MKVLSFLLMAPMAAVGVIIVLGFATVLGFGLYILWLILEACFLLLTGGL